MPRLFHPLLATLLAGVPLAVSAQALTPTDHPGFVLAEAIAEHGCVLHQDDVNGLLEEAGLESAQFPQMAVPLMADGFLAPSGEGTLTLSGWGLCSGGEASAAEAGTEAAAGAEGGVDAQPEDATTDGETE